MTLTPPDARSVHQLFLSPFFCKISKNLLHTGGRCCWVIRNDAIWGVCRWYKSEEEMKEKKQEGGADLKVRYAPQVAFEIINYLQRKVVII